MHAPTVLGTVIFPGQVIVGRGFTITVAVIGAPLQPFAVGVIVKVTVTGNVVVLVSVPLIFPVPLAVMPVAVAVLSLVHANVVPVVVLASTIVVMALPEHTVCEEGVAVATGVGLTVTGTVTAEPVQPFAVGVIVKVVVTGAAVVFVSVPDIFPLPLAAMPVVVAVLFLVQLKVVPATAPLRVIGVIAVPEQIVCAERFEPQPLIFGVVEVPVLAQVNVLAVPLIHPDATLLPLQVTTHVTELSLNNPCASIKKLNGALVAGVVAEGVGGGLLP